MKLLFQKINFKIKNIIKTLLMHDQELFSMLYMKYEYQSFSYIIFSHLITKRPLYETINIQYSLIHYLN